MILESDCSKCTLTALCDDCHNFKLSLKGLEHGLALAEYLEHLTPEALELVIKRANNFIALRKQQK